MQLKLTWSEFKAYAYAAIKKDHPNIVDDDSAKFMRSVSYESDGEVYDMPEYVMINLTNKE